jgi:glutamate synthase domain-containing protein 3
MTGGTVVVLGPVGYNIGAGMTGGSVYLWDPEHRATGLINPALVEAIRLDSADEQELRWLIEQHYELTESRRAAKLLGDWTEEVDDFWHVVPLNRVKRLEAQTAGRVGGA